MTGLFKEVDFAQLQKKVLENPKAYIGAAAVSLLAITYVLSRPRASSIDDADDDYTEHGLPDYARTDVDLAFTQRFAKNKRRHALRSRHSKRHKSSKSASTDASALSEEQKDSEHDNARTTFSPFDPMNPNYALSAAEDDTDYDSEPEEGFSIDQYYVPFRVKKGKTRRKPDAPFMAMFSMYASSRKTAEVGQHEEHRNGLHHEYRITLDSVEETEDEGDADRIETDHKMQNEDIGALHLNGHEDDVEEKGGAAQEDPDSSPPLRPMIAAPSNHIKGAATLDNLKERYYAQQLPPSLQPTASEHSEHGLPALDEREAVPVPMM